MNVTKKQIFVWFGENDFAIKQKTNQWINLFENKYGSLNIVKIDFSDLSGSKQDVLRDLKNALQVDSLFGLNKLIILKNFFSNSKSEFLELIEGSLDKLSVSFFLIFQETKEPKKVFKLYKKILALQKKGSVEVLSFKVPQGESLKNWITQEFKKENKQIEHSTLNNLIMLAGNDLWHLANEIKKLSNFNQSGTINLEEVNELVKGKFNDDIFQMMDAISNKNKSLALKLYQDQINSGANEFYLFTMLVRQFRLLYQIKDLLNEQGNLNNYEIAKLLKQSPFVVKKVLGQVDNFSFGDLNKIYQKLLEIELKLKTTATNFEVLFDLLISAL